MRCSTTVLASLGLLASRVSAGKPDPQAYCMGGCMTALYVFTYDGPGSDYTDPNYYYELLALNTHFLKGFYACGAYYCTEDERIAGAAHLNDTTRQYGLGLSALTGDDLGIPLSFTKEHVEQLNIPVVGLANYTSPPSDTIMTALFPDLELFGLAERTFGTFDDGTLRNDRYGWAMFVFWGIVCFIGLCSQFVKYTRQYPESKASADIESKSRNGKRTLYSRMRTWVLANLITAPTFGYHHLTPVGQATIPRRLESLTILAYVILNIALLMPNYFIFNDNLYYPDQSLQLARYVSDRSGMLAQANLLVTWLFGQRNNLLLWITGWSFSTFNAFHRWSGRLFVAHAIIHSAGYTVFSIKEGSWQSSWLEQYWYMGEASTIAFSLMLGFSVLYLRQKFYDIFLVVHVVLALVGLITLWYHLKIFEGEYDAWFWPAVGFWVFDRVVRVSRIAYVWLHSPLCRAKVSYDETSDILTIDATAALSTMEPAAGTFYFLYFPTKFWGYHAHPFTLVSWTSSTFSDSDSDFSAPTIPAIATEKTDTSTITVRPAPALANAHTHYTFTIRPHRGFTSRLKNFCLKSSSAAADVPILLEGPYGTPHRIPADASDILFIMGGTGINVAVNYMSALIRRAADVRIRLVWALRYQPFLSAQISNELRDILESGRVHLEAHVTSKIATAATPHRSQLSPADIVSSLHLSPAARAHVTLAFERPYVPYVVQGAAEQARGRLAVVVCGPARMADDARAATVRAMRSGRDVVFMEEQFGW